MWRTLTYTENHSQRKPFTSGTAQEGFSRPIFANKSKRYAAPSAIYLRGTTSTFSSLLSLSKISRTWQICLSLGCMRARVFSFRGLRPLTSHQGLCRWTRWGLRLQTPIIDLSYALAISSAVSLFVYFPCLWKDNTKQNREVNFSFMPQYGGGMRSIEGPQGRVMLSVTLVWQKGGKISGSGDGRPQWVQTINVRTTYVMS